MLQRPGGGEPDGSQTGSAEGEVVAIGSSTVEPIVSIALEDFAAANEGVTFEVDGPGTGDGFALFCEDGSDIATASRAIDEDEAATCADAGIEYVELKIGIDGLSVITSPENEDRDLPRRSGTSTRSSARSPWASRTGATPMTWRPRSARTSVSSTRRTRTPRSTSRPPARSPARTTSFIEIALGDVGEARVEAGAITEDEAETLRPDYTGSADDNVIIENIAGFRQLAWIRRVRVRGPELRLGQDARGRRRRRLRGPDSGDDRQRRVPDLA